MNNNILKEKDRIQLDDFVIDHFTPEEALKIINSAQHEEFASVVHQQSLIIGQKWKKNLRASTCQKGLGNSLISRWIKEEDIKTRMSNVVTSTDFL